MYILYATLIITLSLLKVALPYYVRELGHCSHYRKFRCNDGWVSISILLILCQPVGVLA